MKFAALLLVLVVASVVCAQTAGRCAQRRRVTISESLPDSALRQGAWEFAVWAQGGHSVRGGVGDTNLFDAGFRVGKIITAQHGNGWYRGNFEYALDLIPVYVLWGSPALKLAPAPPGCNPCLVPILQRGVGTAYGAGFNPMILKWNFTGRRRLAPYAELGGGVVFTNHDVPFGTSSTNFTPQLGVGTHIFTSKNSSWSVDARYVHISNAGLSVPNPGMNTVQFGIGYHWFR